MSSALSPECHRPFFPEFQRPITPTIRKRRADQNKTPPLPPSDFMPRSSQTESMSKEKYSHPVDSSVMKPLSSIMDIVDSSVKLPNGRHPSAFAHHQHNLNRSILLRHPRHYYGRQYSRRHSANHADASTSHGKHTPHEEKLSLKLANHLNSECGRHSESRDKASRRPERIKSSSLAVDAALSADVVKMVCGICQKQLRTKSYILESTMSSSDVSVVAVLVCGHVYHADCLELRTSHEDRQDPPCPLCVGLLSRI